MRDLAGYARYAVYWAPPAGSGLARLGAAWLGWDPEAGVAPDHPAIAVPRPVSELTATPRRYGLHATLKPPFRLAEGQSPEDLDAALADFARARPPVTAPALAPDAGLGFLALRPSGPSPDIDALATAAAVDLDRFRAPPGEADLARRRAGGLSLRQEAMLTRWGYPYLFEEFRFHVTLTGTLTEAEAQAVAAALGPHLAPHLSDPFHLDEICLFGEPAPGRGFRVLRRYALAG